MARFIIDDENISVDNLATLKKLGEKDKIYIVNHIFMIIFNYF